MTIKKPEPLINNHDLSDFNCGNEELNEWLKKYARLAMASGSARTYVVCDDDQVVGYYSLTVSEVNIDQVSERVGKGIGKYPIPVVLIARLVVQNSHNGLGIGKGMLKDAIIRAVIVAEQAAIRALLVHAIDEDAFNFYKKFGLEPSPIRNNQLILLLKDARNKMKSD
jgi:GNAT superfamily N-acetyltransferase